MIAQKVRLYPTKTQKAYLDELFGFSRHAYNKMLDHWKSEYAAGKKPSGRSCRDWYKDNKEDWAADYSNRIIESVSENLENAFQRFFKKKAKYPKFKKKKEGTGSFRFNRKDARITPVDNNIAKLTRNHHIKMAEPFKYDTATIKFVTYSCKNGKYYISITCDQQGKQYASTGVDCGIDLGLKDAISVYDSNDNSFKLDLDRETLARLYKQVDKLSSRMSKKVKGSGRWLAAKAKQQHVRDRIENILDDFYNKSVNTIVTKYDQIGIEDLALDNLHKNRRISAAFQKKSLYRFKEKLALKCSTNAKNNKVVVKVDRFFPSSQLCSACGAQHPEMKDLKLRTFVCECGNVLDRDVNAAKNILKESHKIS